MLDRYYQEATERLDVDFVKTNTVNLQILCMIFNQESPDSIVKSYYDFLIRKTYKNIGFSIKKLRECMLEQPRLERFKEDQYNSVRSKLYKLFDFIIWHYYHNKQNEIENMVAALRSCRTDDEKEQYYIRESADVTEQLWYDLEEAASNVNGKNLQNLKNNNKNYHTELGNIRISSCPVSYFSKLIYLMTMVLDGIYEKRILRFTVSKHGRETERCFLQPYKIIINENDGRRYVFCIDLNNGRNGGQLFRLDRITKIDYEEDLSAVKVLSADEADSIYHSVLDSSINGLSMPHKKPVTGTLVYKRVFTPAVRQVFPDAEPRQLDGEWDEITFCVNTAKDLKPFLRQHMGDIKLTSCSDTTLDEWNAELNEWRKMYGIES